MLIWRPIILMKLSRRGLTFFDSRHGIAEMARARIGDVIEIETPNGIGYGILSHKHSDYGYLLRVFDLLVEKRVESLGEILGTRTRFNCFYPVGPAVRQKLVSFVFHCDVPEDLREFPLFRTGFPSLQSKKIDRWELWDGEHLWPIGVPSADEAKISPLGIWNHALLVDRISNRWSPEMDVRR